MEKHMNDSKIKYLDQHLIKKHEPETIQRTNNDN